MEVGSNEYYTLSRFRHGRCQYYTEGSSPGDCFVETIPLEMVFLELRTQNSEIYST